MSEQQTWYVLEDGSAADPSEVSPDAKGVLRHKGGMAVEMRGDVPRSRGVIPDEERAKAKAPPKAPQQQPKTQAKPLQPQAKEIKPEEPKLGYLTRGDKTD